MLKSYQESGNKLGNKSLNHQNSQNNAVKLQGLSKLSGIGFSSMMSEEVNQQMYNQLVYNILETIRTAARENKITEQEAFKKVFFEQERENQVRLDIMDGGKELDIKEFTQQYATKLLDYNSQYLELRDQRENILANISMLETIKFQKGKKYHMINPSADESVVVCQLCQADGLEGQPQVIIFIYLDDQFAYKTRIYPKSSAPVISLDIDIIISDTSGKVVIEMYDAAESEKALNTNPQEQLDISERSEMDDEDKVLYKKIGKTEVHIDKILANLLDDEQYQTVRNIFYSENDDEEHGDETYSVRSSVRTMLSPQKQKQDEIRGKIAIQFTADLGLEFLQRIESIKKKHIVDQYQKIESLKSNIEKKYKIIKIGLENLKYISFENERGVVLEELKINSVIEESFDEGGLDNKGDGSIGGGSKKKVHQSFLSNNVINHQEDITVTKRIIETEEVKKLKKANQKEIESLEAIDSKNQKNQRMCGCETHCRIF